MTLLLHPWVPDQWIAKGWQAFWLLPTYRLPVITWHRLTTFLFNNIPAISG